jgi:hypothetical protein
MSAPGATPNPSSPDENLAFRSFLTRLEQRVKGYLASRPDRAEQTDHLRHVADRARWLYYSEMQRQAPAISVSISYHEHDLIEACTFAHDIGKWVPREDLKLLLPPDHGDLDAIFAQLRFTDNQRDLFLLGVRRRLALERDGYVPEYDSAHHLVSAFMLATDADLGFRRIEAADQDRLIDMIVGHQFGSYFKESLLNLRLNDVEVTTGMLVDVARPDKISGDILACAFHDADISDLLFVGSLERRPNREEIIHAGGLMKILMINFTNLVFRSPQAPQTYRECLRSCQSTVANVAKEFLTITAIEHGHRWRKQAHRFLALLREKSTADKFSAVLEDTSRSPQDRLATLRVLTHMYARDFLMSAESNV